MWPEPLTAIVIDIDDYNFQAIVTDGDGIYIAKAPSAISRQAKTGIFGTISMLDQRGGVRQRIRAMVLLTRASLQHAGELGISRVTTHAPERLAAFAERLAGAPVRRGNGRADFEGDTHAIRTRTLDGTDGDGNFRS